MTIKKQNIYPTPFSPDEREILKKWSNLSKSKKFLTSFQRKILYEAGLFDEIFLKRFSQIIDVLDEFSELLDISINDKDMAYKLWKKTITNQYKIEAERGNSEFFLSYGEVFYLGLFGCEEDIDKALYWFKKAAQNNNSEAQYNIGMIYLNGEGVKRNHNVAKKWFEKSSLQNHYESNYQLACMYLDEELGMLDLKLGYEFLKKASTPKSKNETPSSDAIVGRGLCLENGWGVKKNLKQAIKFYEIASDPDLPGGNNAKGMYYLGLIHYCGTGVPVNFEKAYELFYKSADLGLHNAEYFVAGMLFHGEGVKQSYSRSVKYYKKIIKDKLAKESYITESYFQLGYCYLLGIGLKENSQIAVKYLKIADKSDHVKAKYWLGLYYYDLWDELEEDDKTLGKKAYRYLKHASEYNVELSLHFLGECHDKGIGVKQSFDKALICYKKSVLQNNHGQSVINIADIYYFKKEVEDVEEAYKWYKKAEKMDIIEGKFRVAEIELSYEEINKAELIKKFKAVINHKYDEDEINWAKEAQEYIDDLRSENRSNIDVKKIEKRGNILYPAIFQNIEKDEGLTHEFSDEDEKDEIINKTNSHLTLVKKTDTKVEKYLSFSELREKGETAHIEFKQTLHFDVHGNAPSAPEASIVKTVVAFSNGQKKGGELIVGVKDNLEITGLEDDYKSISMVKKANTKSEKRDKAENWLRNMLKDNLKGYEDFIADIKVKFENHNNKDIIRIRVPKQMTAIYPSPVKKLENYIVSQAFYIKNGNSIIELKGAARDRYIRKYFDN